MTFPVVGGSQVGDYTIDNSVRLNQVDSAYLSRTPASAGNRKTMTFSFWIKRSHLGDSEYFLYSAGQDANNRDGIRFNSESLELIIQRNDYDYYRLLTTAKFRDVSAWYHIVIAVDTTQTTSSNRVKIYVNGVQQSNFQIETYPPQNLDLYFNNNSGQYISRFFSTNTSHYDGYLTENHFIDGQALSPTDFGEFDIDSGIWKPISYTGSYGTNGFYLDFENSGSLGADVSGNGNNFTPTNLASTDQTTDTPTNNFATLNPLAAFENDGTTYFNGNYTMAEGNLQAVSSGNAGNWGHSFSTIGMSSGKWYWENRVNSISNSTHSGVSQLFTSGYFQNQSTSKNINLINGNSNSGNYNLSAFSSGDILMVALDMDNGEVYFGKNGTWGNSGNPATNTNPCFTGLDTTAEYFAGFDIAYTGSFSWNFGSPDFSISSGNTDDNGYGNFEYAPPSGYLALCTQNLATALSPTIDDGSQYFNTVLWSGNSVDDRSITGVGFAPDLVSIKQRNFTGNFYWYDTTRGADNQLISNATNAEQNITNKLQAFESDGFQLGTSSEVNGSTYTYAGWNWKANGGTTSSNTDGSITSTVQANTTAGFSIVTWTGTGSNSTIGHGLGVAPKMIIVKRRNTTSNWGGYHESIGNTSTIKLNSTDASASNIVFWNNTSPTSSVFTVGTSTDLNASGSTYVAYCFAEIEGYSKFGSYTGNGSTDGTFIYTGFKPAFVIYKRTDSTGSWLMYDNKRDSFNVVDLGLAPDLSNAEDVTTNDEHDFLSNGIKMRNTGGTPNASGGTYIYMAFAENPFVTSGAVPVTAR